MRSDGDVQCVARVQSRCITHRDLIPTMVWCMQPDTTAMPFACVSTNSRYDSPVTRVDCTQDNVTRHAARRCVATVNIDGAITYRQTMQAAALTGLVLTIIVTLMLSYARSVRWRR
jgi:hypothetical protein